MSEENFGVLQTQAINILSLPWPWNTSYFSFNWHSFKVFIGISYFLFETIKNASIQKRGKTSLAYRLDLDEINDVRKTSVFNFLGGHFFNPRPGYIRIM